jgi:hypothetical protein
MDARLVWRTWRAILCSDELVDAVLNPGQQRPGAATMADPDQRAVLEDYAGNRVAADFTIGMYRRGLVRNALSALILAPMSRHLFYASGLDVDQVAEAYARAIGYRDDGPNFWRAAASFVAYLGKLPQFASPARQDVIMFESAVIAHMRSLGARPPLTWPRSASANRAAIAGVARYVTNRACMLHRSHCDLTPWLENPTGFDVHLELGQGVRHWLVSVPDAESIPACAELSPRAARAFTLLSAPMSATELAGKLEQPLRETLDLLDVLLAAAAAIPACGPFAIEFADQSTDDAPVT